MKKTLAVMGLVVAVMAMAVAPAFAAGEAMVRVTHASPDAGAVDVCVNGEAASRISRLARPPNTPDCPPVPMMYRCILPVPIAQARP